MSTHGIWNLWHGCHKVSVGCARCYMYALDERRGVPEWSSEVHRTKGFDLPFRRDRHRQYKVKPGSVLRVNMTSDTFVEEADAWRDEMWDIIRTRSDVGFWILTKRPERIMSHLPSDWGDGWGNVCLNISCENQEMFELRWPQLREVPAKHKGLCCAPLLGPLDIRAALPYVDAVDCGGENYDYPRPIDVSWVESLSKQCEQARVNFCWFESGTRLVVNGRETYVATKREQSMVAYSFGLSHKFYEQPYELYDSEGHVVERVDDADRVYNKHRCAFCATRLFCDGCGACGDCKRIERVSEDALVAYERQQLGILV